MKMVLYLCVHCGARSGFELQVSPQMDRQHLCCPDERCKGNILEGSLKPMGQIELTMTDIERR